MTAQRIEIYCEKCQKLIPFGEVTMEEESAVTLRMPACSNCAYEAGHKIGYKLGYSTGYLACERGERFR
jgi:heterodisulfide reductase subunit A-like polyferredoxin